MIDSRLALLSCFFFFFLSGDYKLIGPSSQRSPRMAVTGGHGLMGPTSLERVVAFCSSAYLFLLFSIPFFPLFRAGHHYHLVHTAFHVSVFTVHTAIAGVPPRPEGIHRAIDAPSMMPFAPRSRSFLHEKRLTRVGSCKLKLVGNRFSRWHRRYHTARCCALHIRHAPLPVYIFGATIAFLLHDRRGAHVGGALEFAIGIYYY